MTFFYNMGQDKKFSNVFGYYNYNIKEKIHDNKAEVIFVPKDSLYSNIKKTIYTLELEKKISAIAWSDDFLGKFIYVKVRDQKELELVMGAEKESQVRTAGISRRSVKSARL